MQKVFSSELPSGRVTVNFTNSMTTLLINYVNRSVEIDSYMDISEFSRYYEIVYELTLLSLDFAERIYKLFMTSRAKRRRQR